MPKNKQLKKTGDDDDDIEFGKKLGIAHEADYEVGRWYLGHDSREVDCVYVITSQHPDDPDDWLANKHYREGHYGHDKGWHEVAIGKESYLRRVTLLPDHVQSLDDVEAHMDEAAERALALIGTDGAMTEAEQKLSTSTEIVPTGDAEINRMLQVQKDMLKLQAEYETMEISLSEKRDIMERRARKMREKLEKMQNILDTVGLYMGIDEALVQIQEGKEGEGPLCLRQLILYMDEELAVDHFKKYGNDDPDGADYRDIPMFDEWIKTNVDKVLPESRGIVILKVRRHDKKYAQNDSFISIWSEIMMNIPNKKTYFLIRNGENLYRIWEHITITDRLFPRRGEIENTEEHFGERQKAIQKYNKHMLAIQGILDRTGIFGKKRYDLLNPDDDELRFIRDDEDLLPQGRKPWQEFKSDLNHRIKVGTRFVLSATFRNWHDDYSYGNQIPYWCDPPKNGLYHCTKTTTGKYGSDKVYAMYMPSGKTYSWNKGFTERKRRRSFWLYSGDYILNYDDITLDDLEFYITDRVMRGSYLDMVPLLMHVHEQKREEKLWEYNFKEHMTNAFFAREDPDLLNYMLDAAIDWWKYKVIMSRPLKSEDAKAVRMVKGRVKRLLKGEVQPDDHIVDACENEEE